MVSRRCGGAKRQLKRKVRRPACKPGFVPPLQTATVISLVRRLPGGSSDLPESRNGPDQPCPLIWSCSRWGLPSQPVTRLLVRSYIKALRPAPFHPYLHGEPAAYAAGWSTPGSERCRFATPAVSFLLHFPCPYGRWALPTTASCGARTFLSPVDRGATSAPDVPGSDRPADLRTSVHYTVRIAACG